jgi:glyoxylase-like metal-dependent hydrolase (beta-lactamase superfamily II)/rhodanese-related sulfurtransferase
VACEESCGAILIDGELSLVDRYRSLISKDGFRIRYVVDTHTHADHFSAAREIAALVGAPTVMHRDAAAPFVDLRLEDGDALVVGNLRARVLHTPGHTDDSMCLVIGDAVFTGDTLLRGACGRTDLPTGDPAALYDSLFWHLLKLDGSLGVYPGHNYKNAPRSTLAEEIAKNPRLQKRDAHAFVEQMRTLVIDMPEHLTEALRTNRTGGKTVRQLIGEAAEKVAFMPIDVLAEHIGRSKDFTLLDVRECDAYDRAHIPGAIHVPRGQLELLIDKVLPDPTVRVVVYCEYGKISTLAAATLRAMGFTRALALDGGFESWSKDGRPTETS